MCARWYGARAPKVRDESGQALPLALGGCLVLIAAAVALVAIAGAVTGKGRAQRAADLAAISAVRSMRDDLTGLLSPPRLPNGALNPSHIAKSTYLARARDAALAAARRNGVDPRRLRIAFPDRSSFAPLRAKATVVGRLDLGSGEGVAVEASAEAEAAAPVSSGGGEGPAVASGGGYSGPLVYRDGEPMLSLLPAISSGILRGPEGSTCSFGSSCQPAGSSGATPRTS
jgi:hypothetical protein